MFALLAGSLFTMGCTESGLGPSDLDPQFSLGLELEIGDFVWRDLDGDGVQDAGEPGIPGILVTLTNMFGEVVTTSTDANGAYLFDQIVGGCYQVTVNTPPGMAPSPSRAGGDPTLDSNGSPAQNLCMGDGVNIDRTVDFGFVPNDGRIGDFVWSDGNGNGIQDSGEPGMAGLTVTLTKGGSPVTTALTGANGAYLFSGLQPGCYEVSVGTPAGTTPSPTGAGTPATDSNGSPAQNVCLTTANGFEDLTIDFGFVPPPTGRIGDFVWSDTNGNGVQDSGELGIPGVMVTLTQGGLVVGTKTTDANGAYFFTDLSAGCYEVTVTAPTGYTASPTGLGTPATDSNPNPSTVCLATNSTEDVTIDFGFVPSLGRIGDFVWSDANGNGVQDGGELGIGGVTVTLTQGGVVVGTKTTDANGSYLFSDLPAGCYQVMAPAPAGYTASPTGAGTPATDSDPNPSTVCLTTNTSENLTIDFGFVPAAQGQIGNFVWRDANGNGIQDVGETGISGVTVTLTKGSVVVGTTTTGANGEYLFHDLSAGCYQVTVTAPTGYTASPTGVGTPATDSNPNPSTVCLATNSSVDLTIDFGFVPALTGVCRGLTPGYWKNWKNHYTEAQFLSLLPGTIAAGMTAKQATNILSLQRTSLDKLRKFVLANQLTRNLTGTSLPNPDGAGLSNLCTYGGVELGPTLTEALAILKANGKGYTDSRILAVKDLLDGFANMDP
jgi:protocatechuate 3,4-dioxygenase beta subunit